MAERIVERLEVVQIEKQQRRAATITPSLGQRLVTARTGQHAVGQLGQRIMLGEELDLRLRLAHALILLA